MVCPDFELKPMKQVAPEAESLHNSKHLPVSSTIILLSLVQFVREKCHWVKKLITWQSLEQSCTHCILLAIQLYQVGRFIRLGLSSWQSLASQRLLGTGSLTQTQYSTE